MNTVIFTDLDGTLLDEASYSYEEALPALEQISTSGTPLILCSSKTRAELENYRTQFDNSHPFISENGGGIFIPHGYFSVPFKAEDAKGYQLIRLGMPYAEIRQKFVRLREKLNAKVRGFADMTVAEIAILTGLTESEAMLARQRDFDEAFIFEGDPDERFFQGIEEAGLNWTQGRIFHIMGNHDKGRAVDILMTLYRKQFGSLTSIALGDSLNDLPMLRAVDKPVLVRHRDGSYDNRITIIDLVHTQLPGPSGWNEAVQQLLAHVAEAQDVKLPERQHLLDIFHAALAAVDPFNAVMNALKIEQNHIQVHGVRYDLEAYERIIVVGAGKATARMAAAIETLLGDKLTAGLIVVKHDHTTPLSIIEQVEAAHPVPNEEGVEGTQRIMKMMHAADENTLVICLLSGGASALLVAPVEEISLEDKQKTTRQLMYAGASINELNAVRKHLSSVKGGKLAQAAWPARMLTLILSDVIDDPLDVIASGPTAADHSTFSDAWSVVEKYKLQKLLPSTVIEYMKRGIAGDVPGTVKADDPGLKKTVNVIIGGNRLALASAEEKAQQLGYDTHTVSDSLQGEAREAARFLTLAARSEIAAMNMNERSCLLSGGETTVTVRGNGMGGRNQELALAFAMGIEGCEGVSLLSVGTDGTDGPNDAAGAMVDGRTASRARSLGIDPRKYLDNNDSYNFFKDFDTASGAQSHLIIGPTGTNVMDIQILLLHKQENH